MGCANSQFAKFNSNAIQDSNSKVKQASNAPKIQKKEVQVSLDMTYHHRQCKAYIQQLKQEVRLSHNIYEKFLKVDIIIGILDQGSKEPCNPKDQLEIICIVQDFLCYCKNQYRAVLLLPTTFTESYSEQLAQRWIKVRGHILRQRSNMQRIQEDQETEESICYEKKQLPKKFKDIMPAQRLQDVWHALKKIRNVEGSLKIKSYIQTLHSGIYYHHMREYTLADKFLSSA